MERTFRCSKKKVVKLGNKHDPINLFRETYNYDNWFGNKELADKTRKGDKKEFPDLSDMPSLEDDKEEVKEEKLKVLTLKKLLTRPANKIWKQFQQIKKWN